LSRVLSPEWRNAIADYDPVRNFTHYYGHHQFEPGADDHLNRLLYVDFKTWLPDAFMEKVDKATMACGLEARAPILDPRIVEFAFQLPGSMKLRGRTDGPVVPRRNDQVGGGYPVRSQNPGQTVL
jgi:asparagine synthase (glutamine-hydrolysing)